MDEIESLHRSGVSISGISDTLGIDRKTVRKYLREPQTPRYGPRQKTTSGLLEPFTPYIQQRLSAGVWNVKVLFGELETRGYQGKYTILSDYIRPFRAAARSVAVRRFETPPGHQAQLDWGTLGDIVMSSGQRLVLSGFVMTLGCSRAQYLDLATDQTLSTLLTLHERAFEALGGVPQQILYDNMKTVIQEYDPRGEPVLHPVFLDFARYWGYTARMCRPYRPQTKGKVESGIGYVKKNFLCGRAASDLEDLRAQALAWTAQVANRRVHGTTGRVVCEAWMEEKPYLLPTSGHTPFVYLPEEVRRVSRDAFVSYGGNLYSVPWPHARQEVTVSTRSGRLEVCREGRCIAVHTLSAGKRQTVVMPAHHDGIPLGASGGRPGSKARIHVLDGGAPTVDVRSLSAYEGLADSAQTGGIR